MKYLSRLESHTYLLIQADDEADAPMRSALPIRGERLERGEDFADLAADISDDLGSASLGGELGFTDGTAFPDEMESAIADLAAPGEISPAVQTDAGTHFIRLEERIAGEAVDYELVRDESAGLDRGGRDRAHFAVGCGGAERPGVQRSRSRRTCRRLRCPSAAIRAVFDRRGCRLICR